MVKCILCLDKKAMEGHSICRACYVGTHKPAFELNSYGGYDYSRPIKGWKPFVPGKIVIKRRR